MVLQMQNKITTTPTKNHATQNHQRSRPTSGRKKPSYVSCQSTHPFWSNKIATSHDQKPQNVTFWKGNGTPYFREIQNFSTRLKNLDMSPRSHRFLAPLNKSGGWFPGSHRGPSGAVLASCKMAKKKLQKVVGGCMLKL